MCHLEHKTHEQMPFKILRYLIQISRYEEKSEMVSLYRCNFEFPAKQDIFLKIKILSHLANTRPEQRPLIFFRYLIQFSRYQGKSEIISLYGGHFEFSRQTGYCFKKSKNCVTQYIRHLNKCRLKISHLDLQICGIIGHVSP